MSRIGRIGDAGRIVARAAGAYSVGGDECSWQRVSGPGDRSLQTGPPAGHDHQRATGEGGSHHERACCPTWERWRCFWPACGSRPFFSGAETGFYRVSYLRLSIDAQAGDPVARRILWFCQNPSDFVVTALIGNNVAQYGLTAAVGIAAARAGLGRRHDGGDRLDDPDRSLRLHLRRIDPQESCTTGHRLWLLRRNVRTGLSCFTGSFFRSVSR